MKCVETFKTRDRAQDARRRLLDRGIEARVMVESLDERYGALAAFEGIALMVRDDQLREAQAILGVGRLRVAS